MDTEVTAQSLFDEIWDWFVMQGKPRSFVKHEYGSTCLYRASDGSKCAVGVLLADDEVPNRQDMSVRQMHENGLLPDRLVPHLDMLAEIQSLHDRTVLSGRTTGTDEDFREALRKFAASNDFGIRKPEHSEGEGR